jgi:hypothetical protein
MEPEALDWPIQILVIAVGFANKVCFKKNKHTSDLTIPLLIDHVSDFDEKMPGR